MTLVAVVVQLLLPIAMLAWIAFANVRGAATAAGAVLALAGLLLAVALVVPALFLPWWLPAAFAALTVVIIVIRLPAWRRSCTGLWPGALGERLLLGASWIVAAGMAVVVVIALDGRRLPDVDTIDIPLPLEAGTYLLANGGSRELINAHMLTLDDSVERFRAYRGQSYGVDIIEIDALGLRSRGLQPADPAAYEIYGNDVYAPCDGEVIDSRNDRPDMPAPTMDTEVIEGNHVLLRCGDVVLLLAHLVPGSVQVDPGDTVSAGELLGRVGNSGQTSEPHLHISAQRPGPESQPLAGEPMAILFNGRHPVRNMRFRVPIQFGTGAAVADSEALLARGITGERRSEAHGRDSPGAGNRMSVTDALKKAK